MADPVKDAADWLSKQDPNWRKKTPLPPKDPDSLTGLKQASTAPVKSADDVTDSATQWLQKRFGVKK